MLFANVENFGIGVISAAKTSRVDYRLVNQVGIGDVPVDIQKESSTAEHFPKRDIWVIGWRDRLSNLHGESRSVQVKRTCGTQHEFGFFSSSWKSCSGIFGIWANEIISHWSIFWSESKISAAFDFNSWSFPCICDRYLPFPLSSVNAANYIHFFGVNVWSEVAGTGNLARFQTFSANTVQSKSYQGIDHCSAPH